MKMTAKPRLVHFGVGFLVLGVLIGALACAPSRPAGKAVPAHTMDHGKIKGAKFALAVPENRSGDLLVIAHGYRPSKTRLVAEIDPTDPFVAELLAQGWLVATTSYRRNGLIIADAQEDLEELIAAVVSKYGPCRRIIIEGSSMGANIGLLMAETAPLPGAQGKSEISISGVVALGAALKAEDENGQMEWTHAPRLPVLFVSNRSEIADVKDYAGRVRRDRHHPAVWILQREGHVNINAAERLAAVAAMSAWVESGGQRPGGTGRNPRDVTVDQGARASQAEPITQVRRGGGTSKVNVPAMRGRVTAVDPIYGNVETNLVAADLYELGVELGEKIHISVGSKSWTVRWANSYADVGEGDLVAFLTADSTLRVAVNMGNAARRMRCHAGEFLEISAPIDIPPSGKYIAEERTDGK